MKTLLLSADEIGKAAEIIKRGGLVGMPTETVYGLAADALNGKAVASIFRAKGRPMDNPLIVHISDISQIKPLVKEFPEKARILAEKFWPGPLTMILPRSELIPEEVSAGLDTVAIRFPGNEIARKLISMSSPLAAPSANLSGSPSPTNARHVMDDMEGRIDAVIDGGECAIGLESTVITLAEEPPRILRPGGITAGQLREAIGEIVIDPAVTHPLEKDAKAASPGMKYKHYSPKAELILLRGSSQAYIDYVNSSPEEGVTALCYEEDMDKLKKPVIAVGPANDLETQAHNLFSALREADKTDARIIYAHCPEKHGIGLAVYNRIIRAAAFRIIEV